MSIAAQLREIPHPGVFIREEMEAREWSQRDLAYILGMPEQAVNMIVNGKRGVSPEMAKALGDAFEVDSQFFANMQKSYEMANAREPDPAIARRARLQTSYPVREMIKRGWLQDTDIGMMEMQLARFFEVANANDIPHMAHAAYKSRYDDTPPAQLAWLFRVRQLAKAMIVPKYSEKALREALPRLRQLSIDPEEIRHVPRLLTECGVRFVIVEHLPGALIDGVCFWVDNAPVIGLTTRHDRIDNFWFVLRHEIEHVLNKDGQDVEIIDVELEGEKAGTNNTLPEEERRANAAAANFCVPEQEMDSFYMRKFPFFSEKDILAFSRRIQTNPGFVVRQIQRRSGRYELLRRHLVRVRHFIAPGAVIDGWGVNAPTEL